MKKQNTHRMLEVVKPLPGCSFGYTNAKMGGKQKRGTVFPAFLLFTRISSYWNLTYRFFSEGTSAVFSFQ